MVVLPQSLRIPAWISIIALGCVIWRVLIFTGKLNYPSRLMRVGVVLFTVAVSISQMRNIGVGLDSAASLLVLGFVFKLIEMRQKRDIYVVIALCFILSMVSFLYSQSVVATLYIAACVVVITGAMISLNRSVLISDNSGTIRLAMKLSMQALPLTIVLFVVFPRIAPLWAVPISSNGSTTGVSDEMAPGDISQLGRSGELAFRVQFENGAQPFHSELYWRGLVLDDFDGVTWRRTNSSSSSSYGRAAALSDFNFNWQDRVNTDGNPIYYNVILEPTQQPWIFGLHLAEDQSNKYFQSRNFELFNNGLITQRTSYDLRSWRSNQTDVTLLDSGRRRTTSLPDDDGNEQSRRFAQQLRSSVNSDRDYVYAVLANFQQSEFYYTLNPSLLGDNRIDDFLFNTREGFCEHYASSFAYLMRAVGIPSRVVVGYQGAEYNPYEDYMMVYQYNAHAWNEVWLEGEGWVRFDPTSAVSPERIELGVEAALADDPAFMEDGLFSAVRRGNIDWINAMRLRLDAIEYEWNRRVVNYNEDVQFEVFEQILGEVTEEKILMLLIGLASVALAVVGFTVIRFDPPSPQTPVNKFYKQVLCKELRKIGLERAPGEGPQAFCARVSRERPELAGPMAEITKLYIQLNYGEKTVEQETIKTELRKMKSLFQQLRTSV
jgi:transglutaminase-like putative cysteine protease